MKRLVHLCCTQRYSAHKCRAASEAKAVQVIDLTVLGSGVEVTKDLKLLGC